MTLPAKSLKTLVAFLSSRDRSPDCFNIHQLQGAIVATLSSPELVSEVDLGFLALGEEASGHDQWFETGAVRRAWVEIYNTLDEQLVYESFSLMAEYPLTVPTELPQPLVDWCDGYLKGYLLAEESWTELFEQLCSDEPEDPAMEEFVGNHDAFLNMVATFADLDAALDQSPTPDRILKNLDEIYRMIEDGIQVSFRMGFTVRDAEFEDEDTEGLDWEDPFMDTQEYIEPIVRETPKVGRNDPCPCGSGKKYKKCCLN